MQRGPVIDLEKGLIEDTREGGCRVKGRHRVDFLKLKEREGERLGTVDYLDGRRGSLDEGMFLGLFERIV